MKKRIALIGVSLMLLALALAPVAFAHQVIPPGLGTCTTNVHAGDATSPAHTKGLPHANAPSPAIATGACVNP